MSLNLNSVFIGNAVSFVAAILMVAGGYLKSKEKHLIVQTVQIALNTLSCFILGAVSGGIVNLLSIPRNVLACKGKLTLPVKIVICAATLLLSVYFNQNGLVGVLPLISTIVYIFNMDRLKGKHFKYLVIFTLVLWGLHDFVVQNYVSCIFDVVSMFTSAIAIYRIN